MSLLSCLTNAITLEVYIDSDGNSYGNLYLDDGETFDYANDVSKSTLINFSYESSILSSSFGSGLNYDLPSTQ